MAVRGKVGVDQELQLDEDYTVTVNCVEKSDKSNADGTIDRTFKCQLFATSSEAENIDDIKKESGPSLSQRQRAALFVYYKQENIQVPFDKYYELYMTKEIEKIKEKLN
jgi:hypothetical protein